MKQSKISILTFAFLVNGKGFQADKIVGSYFFRTILSFEVWKKNMIEYAQFRSKSFLPKNERKYIRNKKYCQSESQKWIFKPYLE